MKEEILKDLEQFADRLPATNIAKIELTQTLILLKQAHNRIKELEDHVSELSDQLNILNDRLYG